MWVAQAESNTDPCEVRFLLGETISAPDPLFQLRTASVLPASSTKNPRHDEADQCSRANGLPRVLRDRAAGIAFDLLESIRFEVAAHLFQALRNGFGLLHRGTVTSAHFRAQLLRRFVK